MQALVEFDQTIFVELQKGAHLPFSLFLAGFPRAKSTFGCSESEGVCRSVDSLIDPGLELHEEGTTVGSTATQAFGIGSRPGARSLALRFC
jgi:hypothetical protein